jgi:hypothetical protein
MCGVLQFLFERSAYRRGDFVVFRDSSFTAELNFFESPVSLLIPYFKVEASLPVFTTQSKFPILKEVQNTGFRVTIKIMIFTR